MRPKITFIIKVTRISGSIIGKYFLNQRKVFQKLLKIQVFFRTPAQSRSSSIDKTLKASIPEYPINVLERTSVQKLNTYILHLVRRRKKKSSKLRESLKLSKEKNRVLVSSLEDFIIGLKIVILVLYFLSACDSSKN